MIRALLAALAALTFATGVAAQPAPARPAPADRAAPAPVPEPNRSVTRHSGTFGGRTIAYRAIAGETYLRADDGAPRAAIYSTSYVAENAGANRPVTFVFNGGPGSGSVWLHMGAFGPVRVAIPSDARDDGAPPYPLVTNPDSLLDTTDLVFIDPVGTGWSYTMAGVDPQDYWGLVADARSVAQFIRLWLNEHGRWNSPKYLAGESYGTTRAAAVLRQLEGGYNDVALNGVILISTVLDFGAGADVEGNELSYVMNVPSMAVTALFHGKTTHSGGTAALAAEARAWAMGPYLAALMRGNALDEATRATIRRDLSRYTGLSEAYLDRANLRVTPGAILSGIIAGSWA